MNNEYVAVGESVGKLVKEIYICFFFLSEHVVCFLPLTTVGGLAKVSIFSKPLAKC